jgi:flagellar hook protein FlgE
MSFSTSLSGLRGAQADLSTTSNNIANVGTIGFKKSRIEFGDIMPPSPSSAGLGTRVKTIQQLFTQGGYQNTSRELDLAITGNGFFMTRDAASGGNSYFTRAGSFGFNADRYLVDSGNAYVQVMPVDASGVSTTTDITAARALQLPTSSGTPRATTLLSLTATLPSTADKPAARPVYTPARPYAFDPADPNSYNFSQATTVYDTAGNAASATLYFTRTQSLAAGDPANQWEMRATIGNQSATATPVVLQFDAAGTMTAPTGPVQLDSVTPTGAAGPLAFALHFGAASAQTGPSFAISGLQQDGFAPAQFSAMDIGADGLVSATFSDGSTQPLGRLAIADFANPSGLRQHGDARWSVTGESGPAVTGTPGQGGIGAVQTGMLESANVDLTEELVGLITAQRNFQANAKAIETANAMTQSVLGIN